LAHHAHLSGTRFRRRTPDSHRRLIPWFSNTANISHSVEMGR
jgi:hypothetical protein